jgi:hypothetical protein
MSAERQLYIPNSYSFTGNGHREQNDIPEQEIAIEFQSRRTPEVPSSIMFHARQSLDRFPGYTQSLLSELLNDRQSDLFKDLYGLNTSNNVLGRIFEEVAYMYLKNRLSPNEALLSPTETDVLLHHPYLLSRRKEEVRGMFPDGIRFEVRDGKTYLTGVCEYSGAVSFVERHKYTQIDGYNKRVAVNELLLNQPKIWRTSLGNALANKFPNLSPEIEYDEENFNTTFVLSRDSEFRTIPEHTKIVNLPLKSADLHTFSEAMIKDLWA